MEQRNQYDSYGTMIALDSTYAIAANLFESMPSFQGGMTDPLTGLVHFDARDYNPATGRWMEQDPTGAADVDGANLYQAFDSDPISGTDSSGLWTSPIAKKNAPTRRTWCANNADDTWASLAKLTHFDADEYKQWVQTVSGGMPPAAPKQGDSYTVPNVVYEVFGDNLNLSQQNYFMQLDLDNEKYKSDGYAFTSGRNFISAITSPDTAIVVYCGHGIHSDFGGNVGDLKGLGVGKSRGKNATYLVDALAELHRDRDVHLAGLDLIACATSGDGWQNLVSKNGNLHAADHDIVYDLNSDPPKTKAHDPAIYNDFGLQTIAGTSSWSITGLENVTPELLPQATTQPAKK